MSVGSLVLFYHMQMFVVIKGSQIIVFLAYQLLASVHVLTLYPQHPSPAYHTLHLTLLLLIAFI